MCKIGGVLIKNYNIISKKNGEANNIQKPKAVGRFKFIIIHTPKKLFKVTEKNVG